MATLEVCANACVPQLRADTGIRYLYCNTTINQASASQACAAEEMHLVDIEDATEQSWVFTRRLDLWGDGVVSWLGATDVVNGVWVWSDGTQFWMGGSEGAVVDARYSHWRGGEPGGGTGGSLQPDGQSRHHGSVGRSRLQRGSSLHMRASPGPMSTAPARSRSLRLRKTLWTARSLSARSCHRLESDQGQRP